MEIGFDSHKFHVWKWNKLMESAYFHRACTENN